MMKRNTFGVVELTVKNRYKIYLLLQIICYK